MSLTSESADLARPMRTGSVYAEPSMAGQIVNCPGCNTKLQVPAEAAA